MEKSPVVLELISKDEEFSKLWKEHEELNLKVDEMSSKVYLSPEEEAELKKLKLSKLKGKEELVKMLDAYKNRKE